MAFSFRKYVYFILNVDRILTVSIHIRSHVFSENILRFQIFVMFGMQLNQSDKKIQEVCRNIYQFHLLEATQCCLSRGCKSYNNARFVHVHV